MKSSVRSHAPRFAAFLERREPSRTKRYRLRRLAEVRTEQLAAWRRWRRKARLEHEPRGGHDPRLLGGKTASKHSVTRRRRRAVIARASRRRNRR